MVEAAITSFPKLVSHASLFDLQPQIGVAVCRAWRFHDDATCQLSPQNATLQKVCVRHGNHQVREAQKYYDEVVDFHYFLPTV